MIFYLVCGDGGGRPAVACGDGAGEMAVVIQW